MGCVKLNDIRSRDLNAIVDTEIWIKEPRDLLLFLDDYKKCISPGRPASRTRVLVKLKEKPGFKARVDFFTDTECRLVVMNLTFSCCKVIKPVTIYAPNKNGQIEYYRDLEKFLCLSHSLLLLGKYKTIRDARINYVG